MTDSLSLFLSLLKAGLSGEVPEDLDNKNLAALSWEEVYYAARHQTVLGVVFEGVSLLPQEVRPPKEIIMKWFGVVMQIEKQNELLNKGVADIVATYRENGIESILLKGQGLAQYYRNPLRRQGGDIDILLGEQYCRANSLMVSRGGKLQNETSYHQAFLWKGVEVENHRIFVDFYHPANKKKLKVWLKRRNKDLPSLLDIENISVSIPAPQTNAVYLLLHMLHHFLQMGIGLRQVCDWVSLLTEKQKEINPDVFKSDLELLSIKRPACAFAYIAIRYLGMPKYAFPYDLSSNKIRKDGEFLLNDILETGNFGKNTTAGKFFSSTSLPDRCRSYALALKRHIRIARLYPSEAIAYPIKWLISKTIKE